MTFSEFLKLMHSYIGCGVTQQDYVLYITNLIIREPSSESEEAADEADNYNPMSGKSPNLLSKIYKFLTRLNWCRLLHRISLLISTPTLLMKMKTKSNITPESTLTMTFKA